MTGYRTLADIVRDALREEGPDDPDAIADYIRGAYLIRTAAQLQLLPIGAIVLDSDANTIVHLDDGWAHMSGPEDDDYRIPVEDLDMYVPAMLMPFDWSGQMPATVVDVAVPNSVIP